MYHLANLGNNITWLPMTIKVKHNFTFNKKWLIDFLYAKKRFHKNKVNTLEYVDY